MANASPGYRDQPHGLLGSVRRLLASTLQLAKTRLELLVTELEEERLHLLALVAYSVAAFFLLGIGVLFLVVFVTVLLWDSNRLLALGGFAAVFLVAGGVTALLAVRHARRKNGFLASSLAELGRDRDALAADELGEDAS
jgi:uncharacterized membrane protein YqjE